MRLRGFRAHSVFLRSSLGAHNSECCALHPVLWHAMQEMMPKLRHAHGHTRTWSHLSWLAHPRMHPKSFPMDFRPFASLSALVAAWSSDSADDKAIALWVGDQCLIIPRYTKNPSARRHAGAQEARPARIGVGTHHTIIPTERKNKSMHRWPPVR